MGKWKTFWWENFMNADGNTLKALGDLGKNGLLKSCVCYLFLNLSNNFMKLHNISVTPKIVKRVILNLDSSKVSDWS